MYSVYARKPEPSFLFQFYFNTVIIKGAFHEPHDKFNFTAEMELEL